MKQQKDCHHCEGKGYIEIRDCTGDIQREETCVFCGGTGQAIQEKVPMTYRAVWFFRRFTGDR